MFVKSDVSKSNELEVAFKAVVQQFGSLDIVINNAGILDDSNWEKELLVNVVNDFKKHFHNIENNLYLILSHTFFHII